MGESEAQLGDWGWNWAGQLSSGLCLSLAPCVLWSRVPWI